MAFIAFQGFDLRAVPQPKLWAALLELSLFFRARSPGPRAVPPVARRVGRHFLSWTLSALRRISAWRIRFQAVDPSTAPCRVRGLITSCATPPPSLPTRQARRSTHGLHPSRTSPHRDRSPSRGPLPSCRYRPRRSFPEGAAYDLAGFRAFFPRRVRAVAETTRVPAVDSFLGFVPPEHAPVRPGAHFDRGASPLALRRLDVQARPGLRVLRCERVGRSVSGPPALLGLITFRRSRRSVRRSSGLAHDFASHLRT